MSLDATQIAMAIAMAVVPLVFGVLAIALAVMLFPKEPEQRQREPGRKLVAAALGCLGVLLVVIGFGVGACWGFLVVSR